MSATTGTQCTSIYKFSIRPVFDEEDLGHERLRSFLGIADIRTWPDIYVEFAENPDQAQLSALVAALGDSGIRTEVVVNDPIDPSTMVQVAHRIGVVDNESDSIVEMCALLGIKASAGKVAVTYQSSDPEFRRVVRARCYNHTIEDFHESEPRYQTLVPLGRYQPAERFDLLALTDDELEAIGRAGGRNLSAQQMRQIRDIQRASGGSPVSDVLLEAMDARWSDHSMHTTWKSLGSLLDKLIDAARDTRNPNIVSMFEDNAGVWRFYDGFAIAFKGETHNGPSAVSAYFGQLTKLGGVLRDILGTGKGADPIGCFEYTATGLPGTQAAIPDRPTPTVIALETIRAIKEYGNTFGVPMMWSRMAFHPSYRAKPFALGGSIGLIPQSDATRGKPQPGDMVVLIGALTGNEGIHGASASSAGATMDEAAVQIGAPLQQVKFRKAIVDLRDANCIRALTDVGGAGLNSAIGEIGESCGIWINTALVPLKTSALPMWRILLSESQERMILAIPPSKLDETRGILRRHEVRGTVIGRFTDTGRYSVFHSPRLDEAAVVAQTTGHMPTETGDVGFDLPYSLLNYVPQRRDAGPPPEPVHVKVGWPKMTSSDLVELLGAVAGDAEVASQWYADSQYDSTVQGNTRYGPQFGRRYRVPASHWAATPIEGSPAAVVFSAAFAPYLFEAHPVRALRQMFCALLCKMMLAGVQLGDICLCDNFYTPDLAENADPWLVAMVDELAALVRCFGTPVISGKDSSAGSTMTGEGLVHVPPAVFLSGLGKVPDVESLVGQEWRRSDSILVMVGPQTSSPAATVAGRLLKLPDSEVDDVDLVAYRAFLDGLAASRWMFRSAATVGPGGIVTRALTGVLSGEFGADLDLAADDVQGLFGEHRCAALVEMAPEDLARLPKALAPRRVGRLSATSGLRCLGTDFLTASTERQWADSFEAMLQ